MNAKDMLDLLRDNVNEASAAHWVDLYLLRRLNIAQGRAAKLLAQTSGQWLIRRKTVTPVDSVITLPSDCAKPVYLEEVVSETPINWLPSVSNRALSRTSQVTTYDRREAYPLRDTIEVNIDSYATQCYLWYQRRIPDLHAGTVAAGSGASALVFAADRNLRFEDDYYNDVIVEVIDQGTSIVDIRSEITDYVASTHLATITGTPASGDSYGTVSLLPEEAEDFMLAEATKLAILKPSSTVDKDVREFIRAEANRARIEFEDWIASRIPEDAGMGIGDVY